MGGFVLHESAARHGRPAQFRERLVNVALRVEGTETVGGRHYAFGEDLTTGQPSRMVLSSYRGQGVDAAESVARAPDGILIGMGCEPTRSGSLEAGRFYVPPPGARVLATGLVRVSPPRAIGTGRWRQSLQWLDTASAVKVGSPEEFEDAVTMCLSDGGTRASGVLVRGWTRESPSSAPVAFSIPMAVDQVGGGVAPGESLVAFADGRVFLHGPESKAGGRAVLARVRDTLESGALDWEVIPTLAADFHSRAAEEAAYQPFRDPSAPYSFRSPTGRSGDGPRQTGFLPSVLVVAGGEDGRVFPRLVTPVRPGYPVAVERIPTESCDPGAVPQTWSGPEAQDPLFAAALRSFASDMRMMGTETVSNTRVP